MSYETEHLTPLEGLKKLAELTHDELDTLSALNISLRTQIQTLSARYDADITESTEDSEVIDARIDSWANEHASLGANIRNGQSRLNDAINELSTILQAQIQELSEVRLGGLIEDTAAHERRRQEISQEAETRFESDSSLQEQIQELSEACLRMSVMLSEIKGALREMKEE